MVFVLLFMKKFENMFETEDFESLLNSAINRSKLHEGQVLSGKVIKIEDGFVHIDVGLKSIGKVPVTEFQNVTINPGDTVTVVLTSIEKSDGSIGLSHDEVRRSEVKKQLLHALENKEKVSGFAFASYKSGFKVNLSGITAFLPRNQIDTRYNKNADIPLNTPMMFVVTNIEDDCKSVTVSLREAKDIDKKAAKKEFIEAFQPGQILENCLVKNIANYGAFVDIGNGHDGLLHITDISWKRLHHPSHAGIEKGTVLQKVIVLKIDKEQGHISLGVKQLESDPWTVATEKLKIGQVIDGTVTNIVEYGAFIELDGYHIEGLAHVSELSWESRNVVPTDVLQQNQKIKVQVLAIDPEKRRVSLSVKACTKNPWSLIVENYTPGKIVEGSVKEITPFGLAVEIQDGIRGIVHVSDLSWSGDGAKLKSGYKVDEKITVKVLSVIPAQNKIKLGVKQLTDNPYKKELDSIVVGDIVECTVTDVFDTEIEVRLKNGLRGCIKKSEFSMHGGYGNLPRFKVEEEIKEAQITHINHDTAHVELSIKKVEAANYEKNMKEFGSKGSSSATLSEMSKNI